MRCRWKVMWIIIRLVFFFSFSYFIDGICVFSFSFFSFMLKQRIQSNFFSRKKSAMLIWHNFHSTESDDLSVYQMCKVLFFWWLVKSKAIPLQLIDIINVKIAAVVWLVRVDCYPDELIRGDKTEKKKEAAKMALSFLSQEVVPLFTSFLCMSGYNKFFLPFVRGKQSDEGTTAAALQWDRRTAIMNRRCALLILTAFVACSYPLTGKWSFEGFFFYSCVSLHVCNLCLFARLFGGYFILIFKPVACYVITVIR